MAKSILNVILHLTTSDQFPPNPGNFTWTEVEPPHPSSPDQEPSAPIIDTVIDQFVRFLVDGGLRGQAQHYLHVANNGYTYESNLAVFPLFPLAVQLMAKCCHWPVAHLNWLTYVSCLKISAVVVNFVCFIVAADFIYTLSRRVLRDEYLAYKSALFFCLNPASAVFSAPFAESLFAMTTFGSMLAIDGGGLGWSSAIWLSLASAARPNGFFNMGFVIFSSLKVVATQTILMVRAKKARPSQSAIAPNQVTSPPDLWGTIQNMATGALMPGVVNIILCLAPFAMFQWYAYQTFCRFSVERLHLPAIILQTAQTSNPSAPLVLPGALQDLPWCDHDPPISYPKISWNSWQLPHLNVLNTATFPSSICGAPIIGLIIWHFYMFLKINWRFSMRLGLVDNSLIGIPRVREHPATSTSTLPRRSFVYLVHVLVLAILMLGSVDTQGTTRLLCSSSPVIFWIAAVLTTPSRNQLVPMDAVEDSRALNANDKRSNGCGKAAQIEIHENLKSRSSTLLLHEMTSSEVGNAIKIYFFGCTLM
eukprot:maker-scaffold146_size311726-snap-gene-2.21 protein:Tk07058 transcript:maker-scaffold146_size311726-snap-gene-2.21-mRNA-1 annotation:"gpi mannosyltransferase 2"